ncbi:MAG: hypothetical protein JWR33_980 [Naasia sp.]|nr:hypothetical protein [Naasia sp.]
METAMDESPREADSIGRALFRLILASDRPVSRNEASDLLGLPKSTIAAHLERMTRAGALVTTTRKTTDRTGPGSGRPAVFYSAAVSEISTSIPPRRYELMGDILAGAIESGAEQLPGLSELLRSAARARGEELGEAAGSTEAALRDNGFEPVEREDGIALGNCPFHRLARAHTEVVCALNGALLEGVLDGANDSTARVRTAPAESPCCAWISRT